MAAQETRETREALTYEEAREILAFFGDVHAPSDFALYDDALETIANGIMTKLKTTEEVNQ